jgi:hypothetical protein
MLIFCTGFMGYSFVAGFLPKVAVEFSMNNWIRRLKAAIHFWKYFPSTQIPNNYWTNEDARALSNFLVSNTGTKLRHIWSEKVTMSAQRAIMEQSHPEYMAGVAWGIRAMVVETDEHLIISPPMSGSSDTERELEATFRSVNR